MTAQRTIRRHHDEWLNLLERSGPFLTVPVLLRTWPAGLDPIPKETMDEIRPAYESWCRDPAADQRRWISFVLGEMLEWGECLRQGPDVPEGLEVTVAEHGAMIQADFAFRSPAGDLRLLGRILPPGTKPTARVTGGWSASEADRLALLQRRHQIPLGLATDGRWWALVWAPADGVTSVTTWDDGLWLEERDTLTAFHSLLERRRFLGVPDAETLPALLAAGLEQQEEITESLGRQVRQAVEMLVEAIGRAGRRGGPAEKLLAQVEPDEVYRGAVTAMMRLLFLLFAEERLLLPADDELYLQSYSAGQLVEALRDEANLVGEEALEHRTAAWQRLLALFRGIHRGIAHDKLRIPGYGGVVFDPDRHPWLEGRSERSDGESESTLPIDDRTVLHALEALQYVTVQGERRRLSFRALDVEQIGYVYEGLLGFDARRAAEPVLGLIGKSGEEPEVPLSELEAIGDDTISLAEIIGLQAARIRKLMATEPELHQEQLLRVACTGDEELIARARPFVGILRSDLRGLPVIIPEGGLYVTVSPRRRLSGTHYTPRHLAEEVVIRALEPLVYSPGPLDTDDRKAWRRRPSGDILMLKIADIAMGSGAFLVSACRYLAGELIEAWAVEGDPRAEERMHELEHGLSADPESDPVVIEARRHVIEHCLYGGDINEMAVEMAKLSLWLVSLSRQRPFSFLDDRLVCGDSLLGLTNTDQLRLLHLEPARARRRYGNKGLDVWGEIHKTLDEVERLRQQIAERPLIDVRDARIKERLLSEARERTRPLAVIADAMIGAAMAAAGARRDPENELMAVADRARAILMEGDPDTREAMLAEAAATAEYQLDTDRPEGAFERRPTHWPLVFPEVFEAGGFDAVIGNPPFLGGRKISGALGEGYREFLVRAVAGGARGGAADLLAYFLLIAHRILNEHGQAGLIGTNTMAQGDTREVGLDQLTAGGVTIRAAVKSAKWPTRTVNLEYAVVWSSKRAVEVAVPRSLDGNLVSLITSSLDPTDSDPGRPFALAANAKTAFQGSILLGTGFMMRPEQAAIFIERDARNGDVLFPCINGDDLNSRPDFSASRWAVDFRDRNEADARRYRDCWAWVEEHVKPERMTKDAEKYPRMVNEWWQHWNLRPELYRAIRSFDSVVAIALTSKVVMPVRVASGMVYSHAVGVFAYRDGGHLALLSSAFHYWWAITYASTMRTDLRYTPSDVFETFPQPEITGRITAAGERLESFRRSIMLDRQIGLTALYNLVHDATVTDPEVVSLRKIHVEIDTAVLDAYGWSDISLGHGFHETRQGVRFTVDNASRREILKRLLHLNHQRNADEEARGVAPRSGRRRAGQMTLMEV